MLLTIICWAAIGLAFESSRGITIALLAVGFLWSAYPVAVTLIIVAAAILFMFTNQ